MERLRRFLGSERAADLLLWIVIAVLPLLVAEASEPEDFSTVLPVLPVVIAALPLLGLAVLISRRWPLPAAAMPAALGLAVSPELFTGQFFIAQMLLAYLLGRWSGGVRGALLLFAAVCGVGLLLVAATPGAHASNLFVNVLVLLVVPWLVGRYARQHAELARTGWALAERLEREQELVAGRERLRERSRIAGDMHDSLGHELSLIALRAAALEVAPDLGVQERQAAAELRQVAASATEHLGEIIGVLREDSEAAPVLPRGETVEELVQRAAESGVPVSLVDHLGLAGDGEADRLPPMTDRAVYRIVQEALTNATKHAPCAPVTVTLRRDGTDAVVTVVNEAPHGQSDAGAPIGSASPGYGLVGLDERVRLAGGTVRAGLDDGGFAVTARLPMAAGAAATPPVQPVTAQHKLDLARRKVRRSLMDAIWIPVVAGVLLLLLGIAFSVLTSSHEAFWPW